MAALLLNKLVVIAILLVGVYSFQGWSRSLQEAPLSMEERHAMWMIQYGKVYRDNAEKEMRFQIFKDNVQVIESSNKAGIKPYKLGINQFTDLTSEEFRATYNGYKMPTRPHSSATKSFRYENITAVPTSLDWRTKGVVTPIKNQGQCGCCWAFSAVAAMEGITKLSTGKLISLSEQELVDCDTSGQNQGCEGGLMDEAFKFIIQNNGLATEASYPYEGVDGTCNAGKAGATITGYEDVPANDEGALLKAVANQPISVAINAGEFDFQHYESGVFTGECGTRLDHAVTVVGYGTSDDGKKYWLVKNSWGTTWGESGYIRMERDISDAEGLCGIAMYPSYPTV